VKTDSNTAAYTDLINEQRSCSSGVGYRAFDQLVGVGQVIPINYWMTDLDDGKRILGMPG